MAEANFKFLGYFIPEASIEIKDNFFSSISQKTDVNVDVQQNFAKEKPRFVEVFLKLKIRNENESFRLSATVRGGFEGTPETTDEEFKQFWTINAPAILYPYARSFVSTLIAQTGVPPVILPLMNFTTMKRIPDPEPAK
jgi:preprotein translocase subunit SecB